MSEHTPRIVARHCDVAVVGGSAAGLAAALQLARQRRSVIVVDAGEPRNAPAAHMHGFLGREGIAPGELTAAGREEVRSYGGEVLSGMVRDVARLDDGRFRLDVSGGHTIVARRLLIATGLVDELPAIDGLAERWGADVIHCPFCHGYEVGDRRVVQLVTHGMGLHTAPLFRTLARELVVVIADGVVVPVDELDALRRGGVEIVRAAVQRVTDGRDAWPVAVVLADGAVLDADAVAIMPRFVARVDAFASLGLAASPHLSGNGDVLSVDEMGQTTVTGVYAAGNAADPSLQVIGAAAHGSRVGAMIAFSLAHEDLRDAARPTATEADWDQRYSGDSFVWSGNPNGTLVHEVSALPAGRVLDIGAGEGGDAIWLAERGWRVTATDISARALARVAAAADQRGVAVTCLHRDANASEGFGDVFDLVSLQYGAIPRTPDQRGLHNVLNAVAPGGTLLVVGHDLTPIRTPVDPAVQTRMFDPDSYVGVDDFVAALAKCPDDWTIECHETRPRPAGAASSHHVDDVVLRARRSA